MTRLLRPILPILAVLGLGAATFVATIATDTPNVEPAAAATWNARCTSSYWIGTGSGFDPDAAMRAAARSVWNNRYGNFGGWTITGISWAGTNATVFGRRPGTSLYVSANCSLL